jgi:TupA-like ATPgrasp
MPILDLVRELTPERVRMLKRRIFRTRDGEIAIKARYQQIRGRPYDPSNIRTFTDKLFRRMIELNRNADQRYTRFADKLAVRDFIRHTIGEEHLTKLIWTGKDPSKIPFDDLPHKCIIKTNHGCGGHILFDPNADRGLIASKLRQALRQNYFWSMREYQYFDIEPCILIEELLDDGFPNGPLDYRFWCFNGQPEVIQVDDRSHAINPFYNVDWEKLSLHYRDDCEGDVARPSNLPGMLSIASKLSEHFDFVRVDLYNINGRIVFGELTFAPVAGNLKLKPQRWDETLGAKWRS